MASKPRVFLSSTIYDFKDLRSAIRFFLESMGFEVVLSELNDFDGPIEDNSYQACFKAIENCEYFILLIGNRVGGYFNKEKKISITQNEYRIAYECLLKNKIKIISFVRNDIWNIKEDRKALIDFLKTDYQKVKEISSRNIKQITMHNSKFVNDAEFIFNFIDGVSRKSEMQEAIKTGTHFPPGNWIYCFEYFEDIVSVLKVQMKINAPIKERAILENLRQEILANLPNLFINLDEKSKPFFEWVDFLKDTPTDDWQGETLFDKNQLRSILLYSTMGIGRGRNMSIVFASEALSSGIFQNIDFLSGDIQYSILGRAVSELVKQIEGLKKIESNFDQYQKEILYKIKSNMQQYQKCELSNLALMSIKYARDRQEDILKLSKAIVNCIRGNEKNLNKIKLNSNIDLSENLNGAEMEEALDDGIKEWLNSDF